MQSSKYTKELLEPIVKSSTSKSEVLRKLGLSTTAGGTYQYLTARIKILGLDTSHWTGQAWLKGKTHNFNSKTDEELFAKNTAFRSNVYRRRLLKLGRKYECEECDLVEWRDKPICLHLDHKNGDRTDNRKENLGFLCPNCHQQTGTWGGKNVGT